MGLSTAAALARFGLGPRGGTLSAAGSDPRGFLEAELLRRDATVAGEAALPDAAASFAAHSEFARVTKERSMAPAGSVSQSALASATPRVPGSLLQAEVAARIAHIAEGPGTEAGFVERLAWFWANHFAVATTKSGQLTVLAGPFEREAIRPHLFGTFADMLIAAETHPAMLLYLDNANSIGPRSPAGLHRRRGLNENLAREILELHTLGPHGGQRQADVTALSSLLTGWTVARPEAKDGRSGSFVFNANWHEPGPQAILGKSYAGPGQERGIAALRDFSAHPAVAGHVALKLARHFVADVPPAALVKRLRTTFLDTGGDLAALSLALLMAPESWEAPPTKLRSPREFLAAALRLPGGFHADRRPNVFMSNLRALGEPIWAPPAPNGFPDLFDSWASPEGLTTRLDVATRLAQKVQAEPQEVVEAAFGAPEAVSDETRRALAAAESRQQAAALLLLSPEFQRR
jgi:uncharacterized protein (DUF1800 family)